MTISKIASIALVSALSISSLNADIAGDRTALTNAQAELSAKTEAKDFLLTSLQKLEAIGLTALKAFDPDKPTEGKNKEIADIINGLASYEPENSKLGNSISVGGTENNTLGIKITKGDLTNDSTEKFNKVELIYKTTTNMQFVPVVNSTANQSTTGTATKESVEAFTNTLTDLTDATFKTAFDVLIEATKAATAEKITEAQGALATAEKAYTTSVLSANTLTKDDAKFVTDKSYLADTEKALKKEIADKTAEYKAAQEKDRLNKAAIDAIEAAKKAVKDDSNAEKQSTKDAIAAANAALAATGLTLTGASNGGSNITGKDSTVFTAADLAATNNNLAGQVSATLTTNNAQTAKAPMDTANENLAKFENLLSGDSLVGAQKAEMTGANVTEVNLAEAAGDFKASGNAAATISAVNAQIKAINDVKEAAAKATTKEAKEAIIAKALDAGLILKDAAGNTGSAVTKDGIAALDAKLDTVITNIATAAKTTQLEALKTAAEAVVAAQGARLDAISDYKTSGTASSVAAGFKDILANDNVSEATYEDDTSKVVGLINNVANSVNDTAKILAKQSAINTVRFNSDLSTATRLAKLSNPYTKDIALAKAINELSGETFADSGNSLSSVVNGYTKRFENDNNLWFNILGAKAKIKDSLSPIMYGLSAGYDRAFDNLIVGGYLSYANAQADNATLDLKTHTYEIGAYTRAYIDQNEIDASIALGKAKNKLKRDVANSINNSILSQSSKYDTNYFNLQTTYGYVFDLGNALFIKPFAGLEFTYAKNDSFKEDGDLALKFSSVKSKILSAKLGAEVRKYVDTANYIYVAPAIQTELYKSKKNPSVSFVGSNTELDLDVDNKKKTYGVINAGAQTELSKDVSLSINFGAKAASKEQYYNGTIGVKYSF